jgi:hygromycin-B 7''-O-kinase
VMSALAGRLPIPTPAVRATGERDGWAYVLMDRLAGRPLTEVWAGVDRAGRDSLADQLGEALAALHAVPPPTVGDHWPEDWAGFVADQRAVCAGRHRALGLAAPWVAQIDAFLGSVELGPVGRGVGGSADEPPVLLHTEVMGDHLLVERTGTGWRFTGLFDFEPAMYGAHEYDFVGVGCFVAPGDARFLARVLHAYGHAAPDREFRRRMMAWTLLHRYGNVAAWLARLPAPAEPTFDALADAWFATPIAAP